MYWVESKIGSLLSTSLIKKISLNTNIFVENLPLQMPLLRVWVAEGQILQKPLRKPNPGAQTSQVLDLEQDWQFAEHFTNKKLS